MGNFLSNFNLISININHYLHYCYILWAVIISNLCLWIIILVQAK
jgi:hypothetical protein